MRNYKRTIETLDRVIEDFRADTGRKPEALLLGPGEYLDVCEFLKTNKYWKNNMIQGTWATEYRGHQIYVKELPGIEIMISYSHAFMYDQFNRSKSG